MPRRTQIRTILPWNGGLNSTVDPGVLPEQDLVQADNIVFATSGARIKREGFEYFDTDIPNIITRSSSGTTRTLVFDASLLSASDDILVVGESITISSTAGGSEADYVGTFTITAISTTTLTDDTITYTAVGSLAEGATSTSTLTAKKSSSILGIHEYWYTSGGDKVRRIIAITDQSLWFRYDENGNRKEISKDGAATAISGVTKVIFEVINNVLIIAFDGAANTPKKYDPNTSADWFDLGGSPPNFSIMRQHLGRLFTNDKTNKDRLHYSSPGNAEEWQGVGDSAARDIYPGDGDEEGIISIAPSFKDSLFISKRSKIVEVTGESPEQFFPRPVSNGIGMVSHDAVVPVDLDDIMFMSDRGFHSLAATASHGDFESAFLSRKIQASFNDFENSRRNLTKGRYLPSLNSVAFSVTNDDQTEQSELWLFNVINKEWYRWPSISCEALATFTVDNSQKKLLCGTNEGRIIRSQSGDFTDPDDTGITSTIKTGALYADQNPQTLKMFKRLSVYFKPKGDFSFTVKYKVDNFAETSLTYEQAQSADTLGNTMVLGSSVLGIDEVLAPFTKDIEGIGRGITLTIEATGTETPVEIYGVSIEYELADVNQETI